MFLYFGGLAALLSLGLWRPNWLLRILQTVQHGVNYLGSWVRCLSIQPYCQERGYDALNLGLSALSGVGESPDDPAVEKVMHYMYDHVNQFYYFRGLHAFKEKFNPAWEPRFIVFPGFRSLTAVWRTLIRAGSSDDFLWSSGRERLNGLSQAARFVNERFYRPSAGEGAAIEREENYEL